MSGHKYISNPSNLFEDDDVDDDTFVNSYRSRIPPPQPRPSAPAYGGHIGELERQKQQMLQRQREIEQRTLDSSARSVGLLRESEQIGIATAEELSRQREQLENTNKRLDEINTNLNYSQKHLNGIKSVFYGLKNYISGKSDQTPPSRSQASPDTRSTSGGPSGSRLQDSIDNYSRGITSDDRFNAHPSARLRGIDEQSMAEPVSDSQRINKLLDDNLDEMVQAIHRLKDLGCELGKEIDTQNELIDTIQDKAEGADLKIGKQNKQMNKLLGK
ncbi:synaptosomal-associated protein 29 [Pectinophora gossypiella]|uniref:synaptosomal-associated protein 29 n=1 Tax=Pectinophora gossypiella TaxID=13191 RepID=UPI00214E5BA7|nr:synaptosomal-associated protein 29 [Pectinophora gossypiella]